MRTEPNEVWKELLDIDIKALGSMVDFLFWCHVKTGLIAEFPVALERLRANIHDDRWQRKIVYFHALYALWPNWHEDDGRRELRKLGGVKEETDVEILQLFLDLFSDELSFAEKQTLIDRILSESEDSADRLHYRGLRATEYLMIGDDNKARTELADAVQEFRSTRKHNLRNHQKYRLALSLELLGALQSDVTILNEALDLYKAMLNSDDWTSAGKAQLYKSAGDTCRHLSKWENAITAYERSLSLEASPICQVFLAECWVNLEKFDNARAMIKKIDPNRLNKIEYVDYVLIFAAVSIAGGESGMLNHGETLLRKLDVKTPYFRERRDAMLLALLDTKSSGKTGQLVDRAKSILRGIVTSVSRYLILQPNVMGIGVDVGKMVGDLTKGSDKHSVSTSTNKVAEDRPK